MTEQIRIDGPIVASIEDRPLWWHDRGLSFTATGYGARIPSARVVRLVGDPRPRRIYVTIYSNSGTAWLTWRGRKWIVDDFPTAGDVLRPWGPYPEGGRS